MPNTHFQVSAGLCPVKRRLAENCMFEIYVCHYLCDSRFKAG